MRIQELAIIFIIIILPISLLLSEYTQFRINTLNKQIEYDAKLTAATYDAIKAFQINSNNSTTSGLANSKMRDLEASVNAFRNSIMSAFNLSGYEENELNNYIPALVYTLYDGFYIYSPYENTHDESGNPLSGNAEDIYGLKPYINYSCRYVKGNTDVVITYALDNYVTVQGMIGTEYVNKSGYLIDNISVDLDIVKYNDVIIETEQVKEYLTISDANGNLSEAYPYAKVNGTKYYLVEDYLKDDSGNKIDCIIYILNGIPIVQYKEGDSQFISWRSVILNNDNAKRYYKDAKKFTDWFKTSGLQNLTYNDAIDEVIVDKGETAITNIWAGNTTKIFDFNSGANASNNIENELSNFNQHRLAVIRHKIEINLAIAVSNYNKYSRADNVFQMPDLKEDEWENITHNISLISFLQGLNIGGKIYNGYSIVTNSESKEVVLEENIFVLGDDRSFHKIGDRGLENTGGVSIDAGVYGNKITAGRLNLDFERKSLIDNNSLKNSYYYPLKAYNASYDSIVMQNNVTTYEDIYEYVNKQSDDLKIAFYTALGRERYGMYKVQNNEFEYYSVLIVGTGEVSDFRAHTHAIADILDDESDIKTTCIFSEDSTELLEHVQQQKNNYNLIIVDSYVWRLPISAEVLSQISREMNIITISNDAVMLELMESSNIINTGSIVTPKITDLGKKRFGDIMLSPSSDSSEAAFKFKDDVEVFYTGEYSGSVVGEGDIIGCWKNGDYKWIHSQISLSHNSNNEMKLLKLLVDYALDRHSKEIEVDTTEIYTITYDANGGENAPEPQTKQYGVDIELSQGQPTKIGYTFDGWYTVTGVRYQPGDTYTNNINATLLAEWKANTYKVTYNANGGENAPAEQTATYDSRIIIPEEKPTRDGYKFLGWADDPTATVPKAFPGVSYLYKRTYNLTLYAIWEVETYILTYDANGGENPPEALTVPYGGVVTIPEEKPTRDGYEFIGWADDPTASVAKAFPEVSYLYKRTYNLTLYAVWKANDLENTG